MRLGKYIPPWVVERLGALGMKPADIDYYVFHQPSEVMVRKILADIGVDPEKGITRTPSSATPPAPASA